MEQGILDDLIDSVRRQNLHVLSVVVRKDGEVLAEHDFEAPKPTLMWSVSKTFTSMAIGIAQSEGFLSLNDKIVDHFAGEVTETNDRLKKMTVHDLLCMGTGHAKCPMEKVIRDHGPFDHISKLFFEEPVVYEPGTHFVYNNAATYMLSKLISVTTGVSVNEYLRPRLYQPLGITQPYWEADVHGISFGCNGLYLTARELSKVGQLLLNKGSWNGQQQLIPAEYIAKATRSQIDTSDFQEFFATVDHKQGYGYQLWRNAYPNSYRMDGMFGQYVVMLPDKNAVVTYVSNEPTNMTGILELTWKTLVDHL
ncbi:serine hydrolase domain-containing protein [Gorillibacterium timonense]|uniref:serine hydrolase domain-containing protein n=1 Tax=Gorillibacterium timonense TaxID=1689269 RepID=UPI00071CE27C|nr:serine hydrolase [Gorillibacterium timonense]